MVSAAILPLSVESLGYRSGAVTVLQEVSFRIDAGSRAIVLGPNGAGKSVLLRLMHGLLVPTQGTVRWAQNMTSARRAQAMVFQRPIMLRRSVRENIEFAKQAGLDGYYFWGAEWWYWMKTKHNQPEIWEEARRTLAK